MNNNLVSELSKAAVLTFEELGFMFPSLELDEVQERAPFETKVSVGFTGPFSGTLVMSMFGGLLPVIAANMLGEADTPTVSQQQDALKEIANVICGNMLPGIAGPKEIFHVDSPQILEAGDEYVVSGEESKTESVIGIEQGRADLQLYLNGDATNFFEEQKSD